MKVTIRKIAVVSILSSLLIGLIAMSTVKQSGKQVRDLLIDIESQEGNYFIDHLEVTSLINAENTDYVLGLNLRQLDLKELERRVEANAFVKDAQVYLDIKGNLQVSLVQAKPIARILNHQGSSRYIDEEGNLLPLNTKHTARVPIIELESNQPWEASIMESEFGENLHTLLTYVESDEFWKAQIAHVIVDEKNELRFIPQVTKQEVIFGEPVDIADKFDRLKLFYKEVLPAKGWNTYAYVNVKFSNQIVCK
jgi:cell division protein FtsQ